MQVGDLVRHIEHGYIGILVRHGVSSCDRWTIQWNVGDTPSFWYTECELEVLCK